MHSGKDSSAVSNPPVDKGAKKSYSLFFCSFALLVKSKRAFRSCSLFFLAKVEIVKNFAKSLKS